MDAERRARVQAAMAREKLDLLVCRLPENVLLLSGYWPLNGLSFILVPADGEPVCIVPVTEESEAAAELEGSALKSFPSGVLSAGDPDAHLLRLLSDQAKRLKPRRIGFEAGFTSIAPAWNAAELLVAGRAGEDMLHRAFGGADFIDATGMLYALRARKTPAEAARLRTSNEIAGLGLAAFAEAVAPGARGVDLVAAVESAVLVNGTGHRGARRVRAFAQVAVGTAETALGYRPSEISTTRRLAPGEIALLELGVVVDGYWSDRTRPRVAGEATAEQHRLCGLVVQAQEAAIQRIRPGVAAAEVDKAARSILEDGGLGREFLHITGHGTGFRYHEPFPFVGPSAPGRLEEGMVLTVEPGIYAEAFGGIRMEDDVLVGEAGAEVLGPFGKALT